MSDILNSIKIVPVNFPDNQYIKESTNKTQVVLHHTVSGRGVNGDINYWISTTDRVSTAMIINYNGDAFQCFSTNYWGYHLGLELKTFDKFNLPYIKIDKSSIGVEIDSWGGLVKDKASNNWYPAGWDNIAKKMIPMIKYGKVDNIIEYPNGFRGFYGFEKYTDEQIETVRKLLLYWNEKFNIPLNYNSNMFEVNSDALSGKSGIWSHTSFRFDKSDIHPQPNLIEMLQNLE